MRPYERLTIQQLQQRWHQYENEIRERQVEQRDICTELLYRVEAAESQIPAPAPE